MSWDDDPFDQSAPVSERTIVKPNPRALNRKNESSGVQESGYQNPLSEMSNERRIPTRSDDHTSSETLEYENIFQNFQKGRSGINPLVDSAGALLMLIAKLRLAVNQDNVAALQDRISGQIRQFESRAKNQGCERNTVLTARYLLCTSIDESVLKTPWGNKSHWSSDSLLSRFHNENFGGEKFFQVTTILLQDPMKNIDLLELVYFCLSFGFEGKYAVSESGKIELRETIENIYDVINRYRGEQVNQLSPHWQGVKDGRNVLVKYVPLWVVSAVLGVVLLVVFAGYSFVLNTTTKPIFEEYEKAIGTELYEDGKDDKGVK